MHAPMRGLYPSRRVHLALRHAVFTPVPACGRLYISFRGVISLKNGDDDRFRQPSQSYQATCLWSEERGIGVFARWEHGRDDYNSSFFSNPPVNALQSRADDKSTEDVRCRLLTHQMAAGASGAGTGANGRVWKGGNPRRVRASQ